MTRPSATAPGERRRAADCADTRTTAVYHVDRELLGIARELRRLPSAALVGQCAELVAVPEPRRWLALPRIALIRRELRRREARP
ncbi:MAG TPA: hypothetical protein PKA95_17790 [Thermomicrobiales bacterium]|nr:hypothetical protein [Thermomicrobiales bacterium]